MKIHSTNKKYFYFKLEPSDYKKYSYIKCKKFINALLKELLPGDRYWIKKAQMWAIKKDKRPIFNHLVRQYLTGNNQKEIFDE